jgi:hypothetical protein
MTLDENIASQLEITDDIHFNGISEDKLETLYELLVQENLMLSPNNLMYV